MIKQNNASVFMLLNAVLWGSSYIWSKMLLGSLPYFTLLFAYFFGGLILLSVIFYRRIRSINLKTIAIGFGIGLLSVVSNIFCMLALCGTSSSNTAFIVQLSVVITPLIMAAAEKKLPGMRESLSALTAVSGVLMLTCDFRSLSFNIGDLFALGNALFFSLYLASLKLFTSRTDPAQFTFMQHVTGTVVFFGLAALCDGKLPDPGTFGIVPAAVLILSIMISVVTILVQSSAIKFVRPEKATVIYTAEPVAAAAFAYALLGERLDGIRAFAGCLMILTAIIFSTYNKERDVSRLVETHKGNKILLQPKIFSVEPMRYKKHGTQVVKNKVEYKYWRIPAKTAANGAMERVNNN